VGARGFEPLASSASRNAAHIGLPAETANAQVRGTAPCHTIPLCCGCAATYLLPKNMMTSPGMRLVEIAELLGVSK
jgi:hypothetical protein